MRSLTTEPVPRDELHGRRQYGLLDVVALGARLAEGDILRGRRCGQPRAPRLPRRRRRRRLVLLVRVRLLDMVGVRHHGPAVGPRRSLLRACPEALGLGLGGDAGPTSQVAGLASARVLQGRGQGSPGMAARRHPVAALRGYHRRRREGRLLPAMPGGPLCEA